MSLANLLISASTGSRTMLAQSLRRPSLQIPANQDRADQQEMREIIELGREMLRRKQCAELAFDLLGIDGISLPIASIPWAHQEY